MASRSWRWLSLRIVSLLNRPVTSDLAGNLSCTRIQRHFAPPEQPADRRSG